MMGPVLLECKDVRRRGRERSCYVWGVSIQVAQEWQRRNWKKGVLGIETWLHHKVMT
jgi:hypothetical protein